MFIWILLASFGFFQCLVVGLFLVPLIRDRAEKLGLMDQPGLARKLHDRPIPRAGGVAIFFTFWGCLLVNFFLAALLVPQLGFLPEAVRVLASNVTLKLSQLEGIFLGCAIIFILGLLDDRFNLPAKARLAIQILACFPPLLSGVALKLFLPAILVWPATILWIVFLTNSFNFLDNMNGLTSGIGVVICSVMAVISCLAGEWYMLLIFAMLAGALIAFWFFNFPKASIFLGDSGSTHLGYLLAILSILVTYYQEGVPTRLPVLMPLIVMGVPIFDTLTVMWIRWRSGKSFMEGDTNHISHRLVALGMTRTEAVLFLYGATLVVGLAAIPLRSLDWQHGMIQAAVIFLIFFLLHWLERVSYHRTVKIESSS